MSTERKLLVILGAIILAMAVLGFTSEERYDYSKDKGKGFGTPEYAPAMEYAVSHIDTAKFPAWQSREQTLAIQEHLNIMGAQGWQLVSTVKEEYSNGIVFFFARPVARWN
jgi:hypothetical protein